MPFTRYRYLQRRERIASRGKTTHRTEFNSVYRAATAKTVDAVRWLHFISNA